MTFDLKKNLLHIDETIALFTTSFVTTILNQYWQSILIANKIDSMKAINSSINK